ncbi:hypothetical protein ACFP2T_31095 [Plantactinospora solaniradicis]|uniref:NACHT N-terminal Helical domain-containing protein n=1 Tax=Plantactinospora solaniradicis TaxID=1723736 RepID=A0ABW1KHM1_9ACTN
MPRTLSYADAARMLGGDRSRVVSALDTLAGGALLGTAVPVPAVLALFDAKAEFVRLSPRSRMRAVRSVRRST